MFGGSWPRRRWVKWLVLSSLLLAGPIYVTVLFFSPTGYAIFVNASPAEPHVKFWTVENRIAGEVIDLVWEGPVALGDPIKIPFHNWATDYLRVEVQYLDQNKSFIGGDYFMPGFTKQFFYVIREEGIFQFYERRGGFLSPED